MTISVIAAPNEKRGGDFVANQSATVSTASLTLEASVDSIRLTGATDTGFYYLPTSTGGDFPVECQTITVLGPTATGDVSLWISGTATGRLIFGQDGITFCQYLNGNWRIISTTATLGAAS